MILILILTMMLKFCLKELSNLIGIENFVAVVLSIIAGLGVVLPIFAFSRYLKWEIKV